MTVEIYWWIATASTAILVVFVLLSIIGMDVDSIDIDILGDDFSFTSLIAFGCVGGWTGYLANDMTAMSEWQILTSAISMGLLTYIGGIIILKKLKGLESSGNVEIDNAIGKTGTVYLTIPKAQTGQGQVQAIIQGRLMTLDAITNQDEIPTGDTVLIYDIQDGKLLVERYSEDS